MKETDSFTITSIPPIIPRIRLRMPTEESGPVISPRSDSDLEESTIFTISWLAITSSPHLVWMSLKESTSTRNNHHNSRYFDHMIIGMPRQLYDGLVEYEDGTPASTPQMANDVSNFIAFMQRRSGHSYPDKQVRKWMILLGCMLLLPFRYVKTYGYYRALLSTRTEVYAVRDHLGYKHWKTGQTVSKAPEYRSNYWCWLLL